MLYILRIYKVKMVEVDVCVVTTTVGGGALSDSSPQMDVDTTTSQSLNPFYRIEMKLGIVFQ